MMHTNRITAGELRAMGMQIDARVPDCASVPRSALRFKDAQCRMGTKPGQMIARLSFELAAPFEWVEVSTIVEGQA